MTVPPPGMGSFWRHPSHFPAWFCHKLQTGNSKSVKRAITVKRKAFNLLINRKWIHNNQSKTHATMQGAHCRNLEITFKTCYKQQHRQQQQQQKHDLFSSYKCQQYIESAKINLGSLHLQLVFNELVALLLNLKNRKEFTTTAQRNMWLQR